MDDESAGNLRHRCQNLSKRKRMLLSRARTSDKPLALYNKVRYLRRLAALEGRQEKLRKQLRAAHRIQQSIRSAILAAVPRHPVA
jgi:hypothetical protein